jgi:hypothetical protein
MVLVTRKYVFCMKYVFFYFYTLLFETFFIQSSIQGVVLEIHAEIYVAFSLNFPLLSCFNQNWTV